MQIEKIKGSFLFTISDCRLTIGRNVMKVIKIFFGLIFGLFALAHCIYLPILLLQGAYVSQWLGSLAGLCIGGAISITLFRSAFRKKGPTGEMLNGRKNKGPL
jgi:hypothetical protein